MEIRFKDIDYYIDNILLKGDKYNIENFKYGKKINIYRNVVTIRIKSKISKDFIEHKIKASDIKWKIKVYKRKKLIKDFLY